MLNFELDLKSKFPRKNPSGSKALFNTVTILRSNLYLIYPSHLVLTQVFPNRSL